MVIWFLYIAFSFYFLLDAWNTSVVLSLGGGEANPVMAYWISLFDNPLIALFSIKLAFIIYLGVRLHTHYKKEKV